MLQGKDHVEVAQALPGDIVAVAKVDEIQLRRGPARRRRGRPHPPRAAAVSEARARPGDRAQAPRRRAAHVGDPDQAGRRGPVPEARARRRHQRDRSSTASASCTCACCSSGCARPTASRSTTRPPRIAYRETITAPAEGHHRHKKQSGGAGQFGEVFLRVEPLPRGSGFEFVDQVKGGTIPGQFIPAVEKGVREVLATGAIAGYPVVDVRVRRLRRQAPQRRQQGHRLRHRRPKAFMAAVREARPIVLEPIVNVEITAPEQALGDITGDLASRRGMVSGTANGAPGTMMVRGQAPMSELLGYQSRLNALTSGQGRYTIEFSHYEAVPPNTQQQLVGAVQGARRRLKAPPSRPMPRPACRHCARLSSGACSFRRRGGAGACILGHGCPGCRDAVRRRTSGRRVHRPERRRRGGQARQRRRRLVELRLAPCRWPASAALLLLPAQRATGFGAEAERATSRSTSATCMSAGACTSRATTTKVAATWSAGWGSRTCRQGSTDCRPRCGRR